MGVFSKFLDFLRGLLFRKSLEIALVGLQGAGKTTLVNALCGDPDADDTIPTVGFNMRSVKKGAVQIRAWDIGGQTRFRSVWERYARGCAVVVYVIDATDRDAFAESRAELEALMSKPSLAGVPLLALANKSDLATCTPLSDVRAALGLDAIAGRDVAVFSISAKDSTGLDLVLKFLTAYAS
jgi:ADP-ribosylation factor-like protein 8|eukprot:gnl/Ergobibamus_cyprinoides/1166.p1 GENE.gnl/Ergobibamus_cyprinoides/1166~~gnl/Ergobibamus_cyprinoides/1166.p1  ORF type:complete len:182 (+),score=73.87 gnl/Ergobibamus_cyprinoides/1166:78-623(+)